MSEWSDWYVYRIDGPPMGPLAARAIAEAILAGRLPPDCWLCPPGGSRWLPALSVPVIAALIEGVPTRRPASRTRMVTAPMPSSPTVASAPTALDRPKLDEASRRIPDPSPDPPTLRSGPPRGPDGFPVPPPPPSSSSPTPPSGYRGGDTLESPFDEPPRKKTLGS